MTLQSHSSSRSCRSSCCHGLAGDCAELACLRTLFAVAHLMFCAFRSTDLASCGAKGAYCLDVFPAPCDGRCREATNVCTLQIQRDAPGHILWVCLLQAGACTLEASRRAFIARTKAIDFFLAEHLSFFDELPGIRSLIIKNNKWLVCALARSRTNQQEPQLQFLLCATQWHKNLNSRKRALVKVGFCCVAAEWQYAKVCNRSTPANCYPMT